MIPIPFKGSSVEETLMHSFQHTANFEFYFPVLLSFWVSEVSCASVLKWGTLFFPYKNQIQSLTLSSWRENSNFALCSEFYKSVSSTRPPLSSQISSLFSFVANFFLKYKKKMRRNSACTYLQLSGTNPFSFRLFSQLNAGLSWATTISLSCLGSRRLLFFIFTAPFYWCRCRVTYVTALLSLGYYIFFG